MTEGDQRRVLFSLDPATLRRKYIRELSGDLAPSSALFSFAPDGNSFVYTTENRRSDLWMLQGYRQPGFWNQIKETLRLDALK